MSKNSICLLGLVVLAFSMSGIGAQGIPISAPDGWVDPSGSQVTVFGDSRAVGLATLEQRQLTALNSNHTYLLALRNNPKSAEHYMLKTMDEANVHIGNTPTELLAASRDIIYLRISTLTAMLQDFSGALDVNFAEFTRAELMVLIQLRRMFIDEMARR